MPALWAAGIAAVGNVGAAAASAPPIMAPTVSSAGNMFDASGWNVAFSGSKIDSARSEVPAGSAQNYLPYFIAAGGFLILWRLTKRKK